MRFLRCGPDCKVAMTFFIPASTVAFSVGLRGAAVRIIAATSSASRLISSGVR